jgi:hypothetical protein
MNRRIQIRNIISNLIFNSNLKINVFQSMRRALQENNLPAAVISIDTESNELFSRSGIEFKKSADLSIEVVVNAQEEKADEALDLITQRIEAILASQDGLLEHVNYCRLKSTEIYFSRESELELGFARMHFDVVYFSVLGLPNDSESQFSGASLTWKEVIQ